MGSGVAVLLHACRLRRCGHHVLRAMHPVLVSMVWVKKRYGVAVLLVGSGCALGQVPRQALATYAEYSNTSSHIFLGVVQNRRQAGAGITYSLVLHRGRRLEVAYEAEIRPLTFLQDPVSTTTRVVQFIGGAPYPPFVVQDGPIQRACTSATYPGGTQSNAVITDTRTCGTRWTYLGGANPLGERVEFAPQRWAHPVLLVSAGFVASGNKLPSNLSSRFNYTFDLAAGMALGPRWRAEYRYRHLSNAYAGGENPGIDSQVVRVAYTVRQFGRRTRE